MYQFVLALALLFCALQSPPLHAARNNVSRAATYQIPQLTDKNFLLSNQGLTIVEFYADWCGACKQYSSTFRKVAGQLHPVLGFYQANIDHCDTTVARLKIKSLPTTVLFSNGNEVGRVVGSLSEADLKAFVLGKIKK